MGGAASAAPDYRLLVLLGGHDLSHELTRGRQAVEWERSLDRHGRQETPRPEGLMEKVTLRPALRAHELPQQCHMRGVVDREMDGRVRQRGMASGARTRRATERVTGMFHVPGSERYVEGRRLRLASPASLVGLCGEPAGEPHQYRKRS